MISQPPSTAPLILRTPSTKNSPYLWRLFRLVFSTWNFWNSAFLLLIFLAMVYPFLSRPWGSSPSMACMVRW